MKTEIEARTRLLLGSVGALAAVRAIVTHGWLAEVVFLAAPLVAVASLTVAARRREEDDPTAWAWLAAGMACLFAAELIWALHELTDPDRFPSHGDYLGAGGLALIVVGLWRTATRVSPVGDRTGFVDATVLALAAGTLAWLFLVEPAASESGLNGAEELWTVAPLALGIAMLAMAARLAFAMRVRPRAYIFVYLAVAGAMVVDVMDSLLELGLNAEVGRIEDPIFIASYGCWAAAALWRGPVARPRASKLRYLGGRRLVLLITCFLVPLSALIVQGLRGQMPGSGTLIVIGLVGLTSASLVSIRIAGLISAVRDLATAEGHERFAAMVENASDVILTVDPDLLITYASPSTATVWGHDPETLIGRRFTDIVSSDDAAAVASLLARATALPSGSRLSFETRVERSGGGRCICDAVAANLTDHAGVGGISITLRDVTDQRALEDELRARAFNDELTGLANRALFMDRVEHALNLRTDRPGDHPAILYIDLNDFKQVNDGLGHAAGDELLGAVGQRLKECVRPADTVARLGGDEFAILLEHRNGVVDAVSAAARIQEVLSLPLPAGDLHLGVQASIGIAIAQPDSTPHDLLRNADIAMYEAKGTSASGYTVFDANMRTAAANRISLRSELERALELNQMHLVYQPIFELETLSITSAEALLRWTHPTRGSISPAEFIPIAEQSGHIAVIGRWVLERACQDAAHWRRLGHSFGVNINASAIQFQDPTFADQVRDAVGAAGLEPHLLTVEITETAMMNDPDATAEILTRIRSVGIKVAVDDFGTGYCSLAYLKRLAVDTLKIDRAFVSEIRSDSDNLLAHNILRLADSLAIPAVAEGIEEQSQLENLALNGCAYGQGFHLARPMTIDALEEFLKEHALTTSNFGVGSESATPR